MHFKAYQKKFLIVYSKTIGKPGFFMGFSHYIILKIAFNKPEVKKLSILKNGYKRYKNLKINNKNGNNHL